MKLSFHLNNIVFKIPLLEIVDGLFNKGLEFHIRNVLQPFIQLTLYTKPQFKNILGKDETYNYQTQSKINCSYIFPTVVIGYKFTLYVQHLFKRACCNCLIGSVTYLSNWVVDESDILTHILDARRRVHLALNFHVNIKMVGKSLYLGILLR